MKCTVQKRPALPVQKRQDCLAFYTASRWRFVPVVDFVKFLQCCHALPQPVHSIRLYNLFSSCMRIFWGYPWPSVEQYSKEPNSTRLHHACAEQYSCRGSYHSEHHTAKRGESNNWSNLNICQIVDWYKNCFPLNSTLKREPRLRLIDEWIQEEAQSFWKMSGLIDTNCEIYFNADVTVKFLFVGITSLNESTLT